MAVQGDLFFNFAYITPYAPYIGFNHHYTRVGFIRGILGYSNTIADDQLWYAVEYGDQTANNKPASGTDFYRLASGFNTPSLFLGHDVYTVWGKIVSPIDSSVKLTAKLLNLNEYTASLPSKVNSQTPRIIERHTTMVGGDQLWVESKEGDTLKVYWRSQMDSGVLASLYPATSDGTFIYDGTIYNQFRGRPFSDVPLATSSTQYSAITKPGYRRTVLNIPGGSMPADKWLVVTATTPGQGESFATAGVQSQASGFQRQIWAYFTPDGRTEKRVDGKTYAFYSIVCKSRDPQAIGGSATIEVTPTQTDFEFSLLNNGVDYLPVIGGVWLETGKSHSILIIDKITTPWTYFSDNISVPGVQNTTVTKTRYTSISDAKTRGGNNLLAKSRNTYYCADWNIGSTVYLNDDPNDGSTLGDIYIYDEALQSGITVDTLGVITAKDIRTFY